MMLLGMFGGQEIIIVLVLVLLLFGGKKIPELMRGLGKGVKEFKSATNDLKGELNEVQKEVKKIDPSSEIREEIKEVKEGIKKMDVTKDLKA